MRDLPTIPPPTVPLAVLALDALQRLQHREQTRQRAQREFRLLRDRFERQLALLDQDDARDQEVADHYAEECRRLEGKTVSFTLPDGSVAQGQHRKAPDRVELDESTARAGIPVDHPSGVVHYGPAPLLVSKTAWKDWRQRTGEELPGGRLIPGAPRWHWSFEQPPMFRAFDQEGREIPAPSLIESRAERWREETGDLSAADGPDAQDLGADTVGE